MKRWQRRLLTGVVAVLAGVALAFGTYQFSVQPGAALVKAAFETGAEVTPPSGFSSLKPTVKETRGIRIATHGAPVSHLNMYEPKAAPSGPLPVILWIHGGGFISSSADTVKDYAIMLAHEGFVVANLDYSLAPGARYPVPVEQADSALAYLKAHAAEYGGDPERVFLGGDSAGAQIASQVAAVQTNPTLAASLGVTPAIEPAALRGVVLFCGLYDMRTVAATGFPALRTYLWSYTGTRDWTSFPAIDQLSTTRTATAQYPPTFITVGDADPFRTQEAEFAQVLRGHGVPVTALTWNGTGDGLSHEYQFDFALPQAKTAFGDTVAFLHTRAGDN